MSEARREFLKLCGSAAALALSPVALASRASAQAEVDELAGKAVKAGEMEVVIAGGTGAYGELVKASFYDPFTAATGIKVVNAGGSYGEKLTKLRAMAAVNRIRWDIASLSVDSLTPEVASLFRDLGDCAALPQVVANGVGGSCVRYGALFDVSGGVMAYSRDAFPDGKPQPKTWADFWNVTDFPGPRSLPSIGTPWWVLIAALLADGVPAGKVFPLDLDRAFRKVGRDQTEHHGVVAQRRPEPADVPQQGGRDGNDVFGPRDPVAAAGILAHQHRMEWCVARCGILGRREGGAATQCGDGLDQLRLRQCRSQRAILGGFVPGHAPQGRGRADPTRHL